MKTAALLILTLLAAPLATFAAIDKEKDAAPAGKEQPGHGDQVIKAREQAKKEYREMREKRRAALESAAKRSAGWKGAVGVPGWRSSDGATVTPVDSEPAPAEAEETPPPPADPAEELPGGSNFFVLLVGAGVVLALALRFLRPDWFYHLQFGRLLRRIRRVPEPGASGMTLTLRSRRQRGFGR
ncbi:MAG: hypothetical protein ACYS99_21465 [Planctomycetota bacterium]